MNKNGQVVLTPYKHLIICLFRVGAMSMYRNVKIEITELYLVSLSSKIYVFDDKLTKY